MKLLCAMYMYVYFVFVSPVTHALNMCKFECTIIEVHFISQRVYTCNANVECNAITLFHLRIL